MSDSTQAQTPLKYGNFDLLFTLVSLTAYVSSGYARFTLSKPLGLAIDTPQ
tara:strand:- start:67 stop:219 length:153 start_codon:yes stop_codon:yes gene_type:complete